MGGRIPRLAQAPASRDTAEEKDFAIMTRIVSSLAALTLLTCGVTFRPLAAAELSAGQKVLADAARQDQHAFVLFYRGDDAATQSMHRTVQSTLAERPDAVILPVRLDDAAESALVERFDATRTPMPATVVLAPNGAITSVFPQRVAPQQLTASIVPPSQAACLKALQEQKIVLLCVQPEGSDEIPAGVRQFEADPHFKDRTTVVTVTATDPAEAKFLQQLAMRTDQPSCLVAFMAPPGVMLGRYNNKVTADILARKLASSGNCCEDPNCKHHHPPAKKAPAGR
jgi:hypothetical protein